ncbi:MAG: peptide-methionine (R)-S-oxide reductase MsrB [Acholeplasmatales bacterium]|jgi:peptide-methionine (R)-S-oxide reductase|nr:peptide-methionine (R)-S-oxide reductase MsrB [Acholeplasmatales bacterium]
MSNNFEKLKNVLSPIEYWVTQQKGTEKPFENKYWNFFEDGLYVDVVSGEPLFLSKDKFSDPCGWPCFSKPITQVTIKYDTSNHLDIKKEVISFFGKSHLGYLYEDGPKNLGGSRYVINSAALKFVKVAELNENGYRNYSHYFKPTT